MVDGEGEAGVAAGVEAGAEVEVGAAGEAEAEAGAEDCAGAVLDAAPATAGVDDASSANTALVFKNTAQPRNTATSAGSIFIFPRCRTFGGSGGMKTRSLMNRGGGGGGMEGIFIFR